jgi:anti-anti-sigma factor
LAVTTSPTDHAGARLVLSGELDAFNADVLHSAVRRLTRSLRSPRAGYESVTVDLHALDFIDAAGIRVLGRACRELAESGWRVCIASPRRGVRRMLELAVHHGWLPAGLRWEGAGHEGQAAPAT